MTDDLKSGPQTARQLISARTRAALAAIRSAIARDGCYVTRSGRKITRLGAPSGARQSGRWSPAGSIESARVRRENSVAHAKAVKPMILELRAADASFQAVADRLNALGMTTPRGCDWTPMAVKRALERG